MAVQSDGKVLVAASRDGDVVVYRYLTAADADPIAIISDAASLGVPEDGTATFGVRLASEPAGPVTVTASIAGDPDLRITGGASLTFTPADWNAVQVVRLSAAKDADTTDGTATVSLSGPGLASTTIAVDEIDDRLSPSQIQASAETVTVPEAGSAMVGVRLTAAPTGPVTVTASVQSGGDPDITITGGATLGFGPADWSTAKNVTLAAAADGDTANGTAVLRLTATGLVEVQVLAFEADAGTPPVASIVATTPASEGGAAGSFTIGLSRAVGSPVWVPFVVDAGASSAGAGDVVLGSPSPVVIPAGQTAVTVSVTAVADGVAEGPERLRIALLTGTGYTLPAGGAAADVDLIDAIGPATNAPPLIGTPAAAGPDALSLP
jgi:hypothetical protein